MAAKQDDSKVFDVAEPSESKLNIGSKPMVIGHKSTEDPTLANSSTLKESQEPSTNSQEVAAPSKKIRLEPLNDKEKSNVEAEELSSEDTATDKSESTAKDTESEKQEAERDVVAEAENQEKSAQDAESEREEIVEELKKSKKYHVEVKEQRDSSLGKIFAVLFAILVSVFGVYALADAEIIPGGELLPMRFIGSEVENEVKSEEVIQANGVENEAVSLNESESPEEQIVDASEWLLFEGDGFTMFIPDGWSLIQKFGDNGSFVSNGELLYKPGTEAVVLDYDEDLVSLEAMFTVYLDNVEGSDVEYCSTVENEVSRSTLNTIGELEIVKVISEGTVPQEDRGIGELAIGETSYQYCITSEDRTITTQLLSNSDGDQNILVYEEAIKTIEFTTQE